MIWTLMNPLSFYTPWKHQKPEIFIYFQGVHKENRDKEWVKVEYENTV